ncbi:MAG TPA: carboxypeptidase regulatory-like domain-containing protein [Burkholderiales bacterium]|nr:carboxypeptidase regulatory-like domain-containing protein [Burkholderiales bacterium]
MKSAMTLSAGALALALALPVLADTLPQSRTEHGITYMSGGIGSDESAAMKAEAKNYPLSLVFSAGRHDAYLADVPVTIKDRSGKTLLDTVSSGPLMLLKVPAGKYTIVATRDGKALHRTVLVKAKGDRQVLFHWPTA